MIDLSKVSPERLAQARKLLEHVDVPNAVISQQSLLGMDIDDFARKFYYLENKRTMELYPHQVVKFRYAFNPANCPPYGFQTIFNSTIKKSGKTAEAGLVCRWVSETWGGMNQVYTVANDKEQNRGRIYGSILTSMQNDPFYDKGRKHLASADGYDRWRIIEKDLLHLPSGSIIRAIAGDHEGEAGSNPTLTAWTEIWALRLARDQKLWSEMVPSPTRDRSIRYVETYAGYKGESNILWDLWQQAVKDGRHLTIEDVPEWPFPPDDDEGHIPFYVNLPARLFAYIDQGELARRMPWQQGPHGDAYYQAQAYELRAQVGQFDRLHRNMWVERANAFIPIQWYIKCYDEELLKPEHSLEALAQKRTPCVIAADGSVSGDCTALMLITRHPTNHQHTAVRDTAMWTPPQGGQLDYKYTIEKTIKEWCLKYNISHIAYDPYQLHHLMSNLKRTDLRRSDPEYFPPQNCVEFVQGAERRISDKRLFDMIRDEQAHHDGNQVDLQAHVTNAAAEWPDNDNTRLKITKSDDGAPVDLTVCWSMGNHRCMELVI
jgi:phage terminase large subunit-like protein